MTELADEWAVPFLEAGAQAVLMAVTYDEGESVIKVVPSDNGYELSSAKTPKYKNGFPDDLFKVLRAAAKQEFQ